MPGLLSKDRIIAPSQFNRWRVPPASVAIHLCIGSVYAWSIFNPPLMKLHGVVASAADDWTLSQVTWIFTVAIVCLGLSAAVAGKWLERVGPRLVGCVAACCWGGGFLIGGCGILTHQLWLLYVGYGVIGGCGLGLGMVHRLRLPRSPAIPCTDEIDASSDVRVTVVPSLRRRDACRLSDKPTVGERMPEQSVRQIPPCEV